MKKRYYHLLVTCLVVLSFALSSCDGLLEEKGNGNDNDTVVFSLEKVNSRSFTLTLNGARWDTNILSLTASAVYSHIFSMYFQVTNTNGESYWIDTYGTLPFDSTITSPTVRTFTLLSEFTSIKGTLSLDADEVSGYGYRILEGYHANCKANPAKSSITF